ncbi:unnamed protein product [Plutella xylostella]|uniref:(diamondback moth) hypothetical protein n=1 Tax=Plutella xylostella TaxID=51655 RepID=A0A8S4GFI5_PLUXY|nr:unnamed protein product [Plutella xylostella]
MSSTEETSQKLADHPPAVKAGGMRITQHKGPHTATKEGSEDLTNLGGPSAVPTQPNPMSLSILGQTAEYACPIWARSAHAREVDVALNDTVRIVTGCLKPKPLHKLYSLAGIAPPSIRRKVACSVEKAKQECDSRHPLYSHTAAPSRLKSRKAFLNSEVSLTDENPQNARLRLWEEKQPQDPFLPLEEKLDPGNSLPWHIWKIQIGCEQR